MWNSEASTRFRTEAVRDLFYKTKEVKTMHGDAMSIEEKRCGTCFIENEKKEENWSTLCNEKVMSALNWLCKEEVTHNKLNSLLQLLESLWEEKVATFKKRPSRSLRELLMGSQVKENLIKRIKKCPFFSHSYRQGNWYCKYKKLSNIYRILRWRKTKNRTCIYWLNRSITLFWN